MTLYSKVLDFIRHPEAGRFEPLALRVFAAQFDRLPAYRDYCLSRGASPAKVRTVSAIPPVSTAAFKYVDFRQQTPQRIFVTSGTTRGPQRRGRHFVPDLELYRISAVQHLRRMLFPDGRRPWMLAMHPTAERMPQSSLSQMISWCFEEFGGARSLCCADPYRVDIQAAIEFLRAAQELTAPVAILSTTAAFSALSDLLRKKGLRLHLPSGSRLMDTGGAKGQSKPLTAAEVLAMAQDFLGIPPAWVINEYGMTELCSQLYDATPQNCPGALESEERVKIAPPWLRVIARDPQSLTPLPPGAVGLLSFFDLANAGSVSALMTEDLGVVNTDGSVRIFGRLLDAEPRGCALAIEQFAAAPERQGIGAAVAAAVPLAAVSNSIGPGVDSIDALASHLRAQTGKRLASDRVVQALARACERWRDRGCADRAAALAGAAQAGQSYQLLSASLDALLSTFTFDAIRDLRKLDTRDRLIGFIMPGNVMGAGLHELVQALAAGAAVMVKPSSAQPLFFSAFHRTLSSIDAEVAARMGVAVWDRSRRALTLSMAAACDRVVAFGDDSSIAELAAIAGPKLVAFGARISGVLLAREAIAGSRAHSTAAAVARDVSLFDQRGCLSAHHVFIEGGEGASAQAFARILAGEMDTLCQALPPAAAIPITQAAPARAARENARWRRIGGEEIDMWEGDRLAWTVILDPAAGFQASPLCRTVYLSVVADQNIVRERLGSAAGKLEGFAIADPAQRLEASRELLAELGVSYCCAPGHLQSPPPSWRHGGGRFLRLLERTDG